MPSGTNAMQNDDTIADILKRLGGPREVARCLDLRPTSVRNWIYDGYIPPIHHSAIVAMAKAYGIQVAPQDLDPLKGQGK